jgi:signal transduction histidine kinase
MTNSNTEVIPLIEQKLTSLSNYLEIFSKWKNGSFNRKYSYWITALLITVIALFYLSIQFYTLTIVTNFPFTLQIIAWEFSHNITGVLFYIPILFSIIFLPYKGVILVWFISLATVFPYLIRLYASTSIFVNAFYLSIPIIVLSFITLGLRWKQSQMILFSERERNRREFLALLLKAQEDERRQIAQEIHDDSIQRLSVIGCEIKNILDDKQMKLLPAIGERIMWVYGMITDTSEDLRRITLDLHPAILDNLGLISAIKWLADDFNRMNKLNVMVETIGQPKMIQPRYSINIFRIVQEALNNAKKHSEATNIKIIVHFTENTLKMVIHDDGKGFVLPKDNIEFSSYGKLGIIGMQQRMQSINGKFLCESRIGEGTTIAIEINL